MTPAAALARLTACMEAEIAALGAGDLDALGATTRAKLEALRPLADPAIAAAPTVRASDPASIATEHPTPAAQAPKGPLIQVAAVSDAGRAAWLAGYLSQFGPARVETTPGGLHRVRLGPFRARNEAEAVLSRVHAAGYGEAWIVAPPVTPPVP